MFFLENREDCNEFCLLVVLIFSPSHFFPSQTKRGTSRLSLQKLRRLFQALLVGCISSSQRVETRGYLADIHF